MEQKEIKISVKNLTRETISNGSIFPWSANRKHAGLSITSATDGMTIEDIEKYFKENNFRFTLHVKCSPTNMSFAPIYVNTVRNDNEEEPENTLSITPYIDLDVTNDGYKDAGIHHSNFKISNVIGETLDIGFCCFFDSAECVITFMGITGVEKEVSEIEKLRGKTQHFEELENPYVITVANPTDAVIENVELFYTAKYLGMSPKPHFDRSLSPTINEAIISLVGNDKSYWHLLHNTIMHPFKVGCIQIASENNEQLCQKIRYKQKDANGNQYERNLLNEKDATGKAIVGDYCKCTVDALSSIMITKLLPKTSICVYVYPIKDNSLRDNIERLNKKLDLLLRAQGIEFKEETVLK